MATKNSNFDRRIDAYIEKSAPFAQPILKYIRDAVHAGCPGVVETMKWSRPHFDYKGILCGMSAFKAHCALGFWKGSLIVLPAKNKNTDAMGQFGRITTVKDLPSKNKLIGYVKAAARLNELGTPSPMQQRKARKPLPMPADFSAALKKNKKAHLAFEGFTPSQQREYIEWITEAKREVTRKERLATTIEWVSAGKTRNWKYQSKKA